MFVIDKTVVGKCRGSDDQKVKYMVGNAHDARKYMVLSWPKILSEPIVYDAEFDDILAPFNWSVYLYPLVTQRSKGEYLAYLYMHQCVVSAIDPNALLIADNTVDHINGFKRDNRRENLRVVSMSAQNANRPSRGDKKPPHEDLQALGINELPRHVRWDGGEKKFVIENHPILAHRVKHGQLKKPFVSGTKSAACSVVQKYQDITARLDDLDREWIATEPQSTELKEKRRALTTEYIDIRNAVLAYEGKAPVAETPAANATVPMSKRRTAPNRKTEDRLPEGCGVTVDMLPAGTYYRPATEKRGDKFVIDMHPITKMRVSVNSTSAKTVSTFEKYTQMIGLRDKMLGGQA